MIRYLKHNEIDMVKWDNCISHAPNGLIYVLSWYLSINSPGWDALVEDDYINVMPLTKGKKLYFSYLIQPYLSQQLGVFGKTASDNTANFLRKIPLKFLLLRLNFNRWNNLTDVKNNCRENTNYELKLSNEYSELAKNYTSNTKVYLKKSNSNELYFATTTNTESFFDFYKKTMAKKIEGISERYYHQLKSLVERSIEYKTGHIFLVTDQSNQWLAAAFFTDWNYRLILLASAANEAGRRNSAMFFLIDRVIRKYSASPYVLDFEGSNIEGIARFFRGFGSEKTIYYSLWVSNLRLKFLLFLKKNS